MATTQELQMLETALFDATNELFDRYAAEGLQNPRHFRTNDNLASFFFVNEFGRVIGQANGFHTQVLPETPVHAERHAVLTLRANRPLVTQVRDMLRRGEEVRLLFVATQDPCNNCRGVIRALATALGLNRSQVEGFGYAASDVRQSESVRGTTALERPDARRLVALYPVDVHVPQDTRAVRSRARRVGRPRWMTELEEQSRRRPRRMRPTTARQRPRPSPGGDSPGAPTAPRRGRAAAFRRAATSGPGGIDDVIGPMLEGVARLIDLIELRRATASLRRRVPQIERALRGDSSQGVLIGLIFLQEDPTGWDFSVRAQISQRFVRVDHVISSSEGAAEREFFGRHFGIGARRAMLERWYLLWIPPATSGDPPTSWIQTYGLRTAPGGPLDELYRGYQRWLGEQQQRVRDWIDEQFVE